MNSKHKEQKNENYHSDIDALQIFWATYPPCAEQVLHKLYKSLSFQEK